MAATIVGLVRFVVADDTPFEDDRRSWSDASERESSRVNSSSTTAASSSRRAPLTST